MFNFGFMVIAIMSGFNILPSYAENIHAPVTYPAAQVEMANFRVINKDITPTTPISITEKIDEVMGINRDKTYDQCIKEAFERIYAEVNRRLDQIPTHLINK